MRTLEQFEELVNDYGMAVEDWSDEVSCGWDGDEQVAAEKYMKQAHTNLMNAIRELL